MNYVCAAGIGAVSGMRSMVGPAIVAEAAGSKRIQLKGTPLAWLGSYHGMRTTSVLAFAELINDKFPFTPDRVNPGSLIVRAISGGVCGYAVCGHGRSRHDKWASAVVGATAALAVSWAGSAFRRNTKLPKFVAALAEDAIAMGVGAIAVATAEKV